MVFLVGDTTQKLFQPRCHIPHFLQHCRRADDADLSAKGKDPAEKRRAWRDLDCGTEMLFIYSFRPHIFTEAVDDAAHDLIIAQQLYGTEVVRVHPKHLADILRRIKVQCLDCRLFQRFDCRHTVHPKLCNLSVLFRPAYGIIAISAPDKGIRAKLIAVTVMLEYKSKRGIPTPGEHKAAHGQQYHDVSRSRGRWSSSTVLRILEDERYIGSYVIGRRAVIEVGGTRSRRKNRDKWFIIPDHHPAIVDKELFEKVQAVQRRFSLPTRKTRDYPLKGKVYCGCCDHALSRITQKKPFYMCRHSTADLNSRCRDVRADAAGLEEAVLLTLKKQLEVLLPVHEDGTIHLEDTAAKCSEYEKQMEALKDQKQALFERYLLGQIELDTYKSEKAVYDAEILKVKNAYAAVTAQAKLKREEQARQSSRQEIAHSIAEADVLTSELTDLLIEKVYVFPDNRIEIVYKVHDLFE